MVTRLVSMKRLLIALLVCVSYPVASQDIATGQWRGEIIYDQVKVPFQFNVRKVNDEFQFILVNGKEEKVLEGVRLKEDSVFVQLDIFDAELRAKYTSEYMSGVWVKHYRDTQIPFSATFGQSRYMVDLKPNHTITKPWDILFTPERALAYKGVGLWEQEGSVVNGTIMTGVSDFRYFEGVVFGDSIELSSFDGAHAFLLKGVKNKNGWTGELHFDNGYSEPWQSKSNIDAKLPDPWEIVEVEPETHRPFFDILTAGSKQLKIDESDFFGKVTVIQLFGTWCPNSLDQSRFLTQWYEDNKHRDVEVLAVSYEANFSENYGLERIETYKNSLDITYPVVLGGRLSKSQAAVGFPFMEKIEAFPTLVILDKAGYVRYVHSYFNGPATGEYYTQFIQRFNELIDELESE